MLSFKRERHMGPEDNFSCINSKRNKFPTLGVSIGKVSPDLFQSHNQSAGRTGMNDAPKTLSRHPNRAASTARRPARRERDAITPCAQPIHLFPVLAQHLQCHALDLPAFLSLDKLKMVRSTILAIGL